jgi:N-acetylmuramoyl-L-alanine amidase
MEKKIYDSLNFNMRPLDIGPPDMLILHHTNMHPVDAALERLSDPESKVSCHYLIASNGTVYEMVHETMRAWHAGVGFWKDRTNINDHSIGIELDSLGDQFSKPLMESLVLLIQDIRTRYEIPDLNILGHSDIAPTRKDDPSEHFDWEFLAANGIGWMPKGAEILEEDPPLVAVQSWLQIIGYSLDLTGVMDTKTEHVIKAFQRHFRRTKVDGALDRETVFRILECKKAHEQALASI